MNYKNTIITLIIISIINIPNLAHPVRIQTTQFADTGNLPNESIKKQAQYSAEKDAIQDTNKLVWFGTGLGCCVTTTSCAFVGCFVGGAINPPPIVEDSGDIFLYDTTQIGEGSNPFEDGSLDEGCFIGSILGCVIPLIGVYNYKINPSPEKLIGKSPEYVEHYTKTYKDKKRSIRRNMAIAGFSAGCLSVSAFTLLADSLSNR